MREPPDQLPDVRGDLSICVQAPYMMYVEILQCEKNLTSSLMYVEILTDWSLTVQAD